MSALLKVGLPLHPRSSGGGEGTSVTLVKQSKWSTNVVMWPLGTTLLKIIAAF